jgi:acyl carrier protein
VTIDPRLADLLGELFGIPEEDLRPGADLETDLQLDSLAVVELQVALEDATGVRMGGEEDIDLRTLGDLQALVERGLVRAEPAIPTLNLREEEAWG